MILPGHNRLARLCSVVAALVLVLIWYRYLHQADDSSFHYEYPSGLLALSRLGGGGGDGAAKTSRVAKVTVAANALDHPVIHRALQTHEKHNKRHGYRHFVGTREAVSKAIENDSQSRPGGAWTKPSYLLSVMVAELQKDEDERLQWLFWFDADTIIANYHTPLETFLPPASNADLANVHLLMASNWDGLNSGAFALRVHPWSVTLLSAVLAYPIYQPGRHKSDRFRDQSAFQWLLQGADSPLAQGSPVRGRDRWAVVPMRWFNALPFNNAFARSGDWLLGHNMTNATFDAGTADIYDDGHQPPGLVRPWKVMRGDLAVHFAGTTAGNVRDSWLGPWLDRVEAETPEWSNATTQVVLRAEAEALWNATAERIVVGRTHPQEGLDRALRAEKDMSGKAAVNGQR